MTEQHPEENALTPVTNVVPEALSAPLLADIRALIEQSKERVAQTVNSELTMLYWHIGDRIRRDILQEKRAEYGERIVSTLSRQLTTDYGQSYNPKSLFHMIRFAEVFSDNTIVSTLSRQLSWSHFKEIIYFEDALQREFYTEMCRIERWSVRTLRAKISGRLFERTALSRKTEDLIQQELDALREEDRMTPDMVFRDPYLLDFLNLTDSYSESDLEAAILREMEAFLLELGAGFAFVERQKRMTIGGEDFYLDLLFFHRKLRRLVAIELKLDAFTAAYKGQMELYLRWLDRYERQPSEEAPVGIILCSKKENREQIELSATRSGRYSRRGIFDGTTASSPAG